MERRDFVRNATLATAVLAFAPRSLANAGAAITAPVGSRLLANGLPYGPLGAPDAQGIRLPAGFTSRIVAGSSFRVPGTTYVWHASPDGGACFVVPNGNGDYVYVSNSEITSGLKGGTSAIRFAKNGEIRAAYRILSGTNINCAGGPTPWGTWLSGEEHDAGQIWECNPFAPSQGVARPALGIYKHEAATVDPVHKHVYLTEDTPDGRLYRFTPAVYPNLDRGRLEVAGVVGKDVGWVIVSDGTVGATKPRPAGSTAFNGGEGIWWHAGVVYFTTKGDNRVWALDTKRQTLRVIYDDDLVVDAPLHGVDNVTVSRSGEILVAEDGDDMQINVLRGSVVGPVLQIIGQDKSEITGPAFGPRGDRLYFSSQRGIGGVLGITYEVRGPFRGRR